jgi:hypothetical protein
LDEQVRMQDCHEAEIHRLARQVRDSQEQLDAIRGVLSRSHVRADRQSLPDPTCYSRPTAELIDTGSPPLPPERLIDTSTPPVGSDLILGPLLRSTEYSRARSWERRAERR